MRWIARRRAGGRPGRPAAMDGPGRRPGRRRLGRWAAVIVVVAALFYTAMGFAVTTFLIGNHARWRESGRGPAALWLAGETVSLRAADGVALKAWWMPAQGQARGTVVIAHGIDHTREVMLPRAAFLVRGGYNALVLDLRGHGASAGDVVSPGVLEARDVQAGARFARERVPALPLAVLGVSYGAIAALRAAAEPGTFDAVVSDGASPSTASTYRNIVRHFVRNPGSPLWLRVAATCAAAPGIPAAFALVYYARTGIWLGLDAGSLDNVAPRVRLPVLLVSGSRDWMVHTADARRLRRTLGSRSSSLVVIPGATHDRTYDTQPDLYRSSVLSFLEAALPAPGAYRGGGSGATPRL